MLHLQLGNSVVRCLIQVLRFKLSVSLLVSLTHPGCTYVILVLYYICTDSVLITPFQGSTIAGENYTLECSTCGAMATFEWLGPPDGRTAVVNSSSVTIMSNSFTSQLQFRPLQQSHNGSYSCRATTDEDILSVSEPTVIRVNGNNMQYI